MARFWRRKSSDRRGSHLIEFALVTPLFLILVFGVVEFGWFFTRQLAVTHSAREAARSASVASRSQDRELVAREAFVSRMAAEGITDNVA